MSDDTFNPMDRAALDDILTRIERQMAETRKLGAEQNKLAVESLRLSAEQNKLAMEALKLGAEQRKLDRDRWLAPSLAITSLAGGIVAVATLIGHALHLLP